MFTLNTPTTVSLDNVQSRIERHGEEHVTAIDLAVTLATNNRALESLVPGLRAALYGPVPIPTKADQQEMQLPVDELPCLRFVHLAYPLKWDAEQIGMTCRIDYGLGGDSDIVLNLCKVCNWRITPIEGGTVKVKFAISSAADIDAEIIGSLSVMQQSDISITLAAPKVDEPEKPLTPADVFTSPFPEVDENANPVVRDEEAAAQSVEEAFVGTSKPARKGRKAAV